MENSQLSWVSSVSQTNDLLGDLSIKSGKLALILLVSSRDSEDCCAKNYERTVFRDPKVIKYAQNNLMPYRFDREVGLGKELYDKFKLLGDKPAILILDRDGELLYKSQKCTEPRRCAEAMIGATQVSLKKSSYSTRTEKALVGIEELIQSKSYRDALLKLDGVQTKLLYAPLRERVGSQYRAIETAGKKRLALAAKYEERKNFKRASELYQEVSQAFSRLEKLKSQALTGLKRVKKLEMTQVPEVSTAS